MQPGIKRWTCLNQQRRAFVNVCNDMMQWSGLRVWTVDANMLNKKSRRQPTRFGAPAEGWARY